MAYLKYNTFNNYAYDKLVIIAIDFAHRREIYK